MAWKTEKYHYATLKIISSKISMNFASLGRLLMSKLGV
jgi:hypothetical protein